MGGLVERFPKYALLLVGILIGCAHLWFAIKAMFVFRNDEPFAMWIFIVSGPLSTLPAVIVGFFWPKIGGTWLILSSILSFFFALAGIQINGNLQQMLWYFASYSAPMLALGIAALFVNGTK